MEDKVCTKEYPWTSKLAQFLALFSLSMVILSTITFIISLTTSLISSQYAPGPYVKEKLAPQPFSYEYGVADDYSKANFKKTETQDANGVVSGSFTIALPDGRIQTVTYSVAPDTGFVVNFQISERYVLLKKAGFF